MLKIDGGTHIRYMTLGKLKELLAQVEDDTLIATCSEVTGNVVLYRSDNFEYEDMTLIINFNAEALQTVESDEEDTPDDVL